MGYPRPEGDARRTVSRGPRPHRGQRQGAAGRVVSCHGVPGGSRRLESAAPFGYKRGMASLVALKGPSPGQRFTLEGEGTLIGRQPDVGVYLDSLAVSRQHARVLWDN